MKIDRNMSQDRWTTRDVSKRIGHSRSHRIETHDEWNHMCNANRAAEIQHAVIMT